MIIILVYQSVKNQKVKVSTIIEVRYNCIAHISAHLFVTAISSNSHKELKQPQIIFLQYSCSVTMIETNLVPPYFLPEILMERSSDSQNKEKNHRRQIGLH